jgi:hypothetical protein
MDDETILELIADFLRNRNLLRSSEILDEERGKSSNKNVFHSL